MTWNPAVPALANLVANDIPDIAENLEELALAVEKRSLFTYNGGTTAYTILVGAGWYYVKNKVAKWVTELTTDTVAAVPAAADWYYLYLDYSAITSGTVITKDEFVWSTTEPAYSHTYRGWYSGDDRCIFAVKTNAGPTNILEFWHDGGAFVQWADGYTVISESTPSTTWTFADFSIAMPYFSNNCVLISSLQYIDADASAYIKTTGQAGTSGHLLGTVADATAVWSTNTINIYVQGTTKKVDIKWGAATTNKISGFLLGWYLSGGM